MNNYHGRNIPDNSSNFLMKETKKCFKFCFSFIAVAFYRRTPSVARLWSDLGSFCNRASGGSMEVKIKFCIKGGWMGRG